MKAIPPTSRLDLWRKSARFRSIARDQCRRMNAAKAKADRCGARRKRDGLPCELPGLENGRCHLHGGRTPKGDGWHRPIWPNKAAPNAEEKLNRKLQDLERAAQKRAKRVAAMTPERRAKYDRWQRSHRPGSRTARAASRDELRRNDEAKRDFAKPPPVREPTAEEIALADAIARATRRFEELNSELPNIENQGVFA